MLQKILGTRAAPPTRLGHRPALDGLRGVAFLLVFVGHAGLSPLPGTARVAMYLFFGLSGFLITSLLVEEHARNGTISLRRFAARRALRLVPALLVFLVAWCAVSLIAGSNTWMTTVPGATAGSVEPFWKALTSAGEAVSYVANWLTIGGSFAGSLPLGHLWSLSVEEQFYLVWAPLLALLLACSRRSAAIVAGVLAVASLLEVALLVRTGHGNWIYYGTDTRAGAFLLGAVGAIAWASGALRVLSRRHLGDLLALVALAVLVRSTVSVANEENNLSFIGFWVAASLAGPAAVVAVVAQPVGRVARALSTTVIRYVGRRSYGLYLWHYVWLTWLHNLGMVGIALALSCTFACAEISWHLVEKQALRFKRLLGSGAAADNATRTPAVAPAIAG